MPNISKKQADTIKALLYLYFKTREAVLKDNKPQRVAKRLWIYWDSDKVLNDYRRPTYEELVMICIAIKEELANEA
jgi:hypothetical protein